MICQGIRTLGFDRAALAKPRMVGIFVVAVMTAIVVVSSIGMYAMANSQQAIDATSTSDPSQASSNDTSEPIDWGSVSVSPHDPLRLRPDGTYELEYGSQTGGTVESMLDVTGGVVVTSTNPIDSMTVGITSCDVTLEADGLTATRLVTIAVTDTQTPSVALGEQTVHVTQGDSLDPAANATVSDPVDGELRRVDAEPNEPAGDGWYVVDTDANPDAPGTYTARLHGADRNGNTFETSWAIVIDDPKALEASEQKLVDNAEREAALVETGRSQLGVPYKSMHYGPKGSGDEGFGCAMFVAYCYNTVMFNGHRGDDMTEYPHYTGYVYGATTVFWGAVSHDGGPNGINEGFVEVPASEARPGDVICFVNGDDPYSSCNNCNHVALYVGDSRMIEGGGTEHDFDMSNGTLHYLHYVGV